MRIAGITYPDVANGIGFRVTLWVQGCSHRCPGCHNSGTWDFNGGKEFDEEEKKKLFDVLSKPYIKGLTLSGGDPLFSYSDIIVLLKEVREKFPDKDVWLWSGFTLDSIRGRFPAVLTLVDYIVDGKFDETKKDLTLAFRGSSNQTIWEKNENGEFVRSELN